jgi:phosphoribosyl-dephospho-CoA transferase
MPYDANQTWPLPHTLVWCEQADALITDGDGLPDWVAAAWGAARPLVVRRAQLNQQLIPVGVRGDARHLRCAAWLPRDQISRSVTPQQIAQQQAWLTHPQQQHLPPLIALGQLAPRLNTLNLGWGITGATGFELASGIAVLRPASDLDLSILCPQPISHQQAQHWLTLLYSPDCRIDLQLETPHGAVALAEWARGGKTLLKTNQGPVLVTDPWAIPASSLTDSQARNQA